MQKITPLPTPPTTHDTQSFDIRADAFVEALPQFGEELNAFGVQINELGTSVEQSLRELELELKENLKQDRQGFKTEVESEKNNAIKEILAHTALQSDQFINIAHHILFTLREIKHKRQKQKEEQDKIGHYAVFLRSSLPQGYKEAGSLLRISEYPLAYEFFKNTSKNLQENCSAGFFRLPKAGVFARGTQNPAMVGAYTEDSIKSHTHGYGRANLFDGSWRGGGKNDLNRATGNVYWTQTDAFGSGESAPKHNHLLEGFYVGGRIPPPPEKE